MLGRGKNKKALLPPPAVASNESIALVTSEIVRALVTKEEEAPARPTQVAP